MDIGECEPCKNLIKTSVNDKISTRLVRIL